MAETDEPTPELLEDLSAYINRQVQAGFADASEIPQAACDYLADECSADALRPHADGFLTEALAALAKEQAAWPETTDCDRLDAAFSSLEADGILARQDFTCCQTCGHAEMGLEIDEALERGRSVRGYTFFHQQDTEAVVDGSGLCLAYGAVEYGDEAMAAVADAVVRALTAVGLRVKWDGSVKKRIFAELQWRRRR